MASESPAGARLVWVWYPYSCYLAFWRWISKALDTTKSDFPSVTCVCMSDHNNYSLFDSGSGNHPRSRTGIFCPNHSYKLAQCQKIIVCKLHRESSTVHVSDLIRWSSRDETSRAYFHEGFSMNISFQNCSNINVITRINWLIVWMLQFLLWL